MAQYKAEHFTRHRGLTERKPVPGQTRTNLLFENPTSRRFCDDQVTLNYNDPNYMSVNQRLVGKPNPKTLIPPIVVPPPADLGFWKANNLINHSAINTASQIDISRSGYQVETQCGVMDDKYMVPVETPNVIPTCTENFESTTENFQMPYIKQQGPRVRENQPGFVNTSCGYNPEQLQVAGLPTNYPAGNCEQDPVLKQYNDNLFTQTIQPGVYTRNQINEPINSNIGISFTQQLPPLTCKATQNGGVMYTEHDPRIIEPVEIQENMDVINAVNQSNIYDPRHTGYGTSYRAYTDDNLGQTKFFYDDIDAIKMPNYISRSNIDFAPFADSYGPLKPGAGCGNTHNSSIRALANDAFLRSTIEQRTELQERLLRKFNTRYSQQRMAPIRTGGQRMMGGMSCGAGGGGGAGLC